MINDTYQHVYDVILSSGREWRFDGVLKRPTYEDVQQLIDRMIEQVRKSLTSISIESGGILVKRTDERIDVYVFAGGV